MRKYEVTILAISVGNIMQQDLQKLLIHYRNNNPAPKTLREHGVALGYGYKSACMLAKQGWLTQV